MDKSEMKEKRIWAVVGVTPDHMKFGYRIFEHLLDSGRVVYPINPKYTEIEGKRCYKSLKDLPELPEVIDFVVAPAYGKSYIKEAIDLGIRNLWFQPGSHDSELLEYARSSGCNVVTACALVEVE